MPRLHKYVSRDAHYVLTSINGSVITYQLTSTGESKLAAAGIEPGQNFERAILLDLYRTGDAFARGGEFAEAVLANQLEMDFAGDPNPESAFPTCDDCPSVNDLHLTLTGSLINFTARLQCPTCRERPANIADTSVPLSLLARPLLSRLFEMKPVSVKADNVLRYEALLEAAFAVRWDAVRRQRSAGQSLLFSDGELGGLDFA
jgi:hypothetical protein